MTKKYTFLVLCFFTIVSNGNTIAKNFSELNAICTIPAPTNNNTCSTPLETINLGGLPATGFWTLHKVYNNSVTTVITGSGSTFTDTGLTSGCYNYKVTDSNGCTSTALVVCLGYLVGLSGTMTGTYVDYNNDGVTNVGDIVRYNLSITNGTICPVDVTYDLGSAISAGSGTITNLAVGATDTSGIVDYVLKQIDINNGIVSNWVSLNGLSPNGQSSYDKVFMPNDVMLSISEGIRLNAFFDTNNNGVQNNGEANVTTGHFNYVINDVGNIHSIYSSTGTDIIYETSAANGYDLSFVAHNYCDGQSYTSATTYNDIHVAAGSGITTYNFPVAVSQCQDTQVHLYGLWPRPNSSFANQIVYSNYGNQALASGTITFTCDPSLTVISVSDPNAVITATGFTCNFTNLPPNQSRLITVVMSVPPIPTINLGDEIHNSVSLSIPPTDVYPSNNSDSRTTFVVNSFDPNCKTENHGGKIVYSTFTANDYLTYMIQFENIGNANAINVRVNDVLDNHLDFETIKMVDASHPYVLERINGILNWRFNGINLPPSNGSQTVGHGYIVFQVKPKAGAYAVGDLIRNDANIYFDSNPAILTNVAITEFVQSMNVDEVAFTHFNYSPNPVKSSLEISNSSRIDTVEIISVLGQRILVEKINDLQAEIDLSPISKGIYFVKATSEGQEKVVRIIKE